jgi:excisionase family DNA binding protein
MQDRKYLNFKETADYLGICVYTLRKWVREQGFPVAKIGNSVRVDREQADQWMKRQQEVKG